MDIVKLYKRFGIVMGTEALPSGVKHKRRHEYYELVCFQKPQETDRLGRRRCTGLHSPPRAWPLCRQGEIGGEGERFREFGRPAIACLWPTQCRERSCPLWAGTGSKELSDRWTGGRPHSMLHQYGAPGSHPCPLDDLCQ